MEGFEPYRTADASRMAEPMLSLDPSLAERFMADHADVGAVEFRVVDALGLARGKWGPRDALDKAYREGIAFPLSMLGLDRWGREVPATGLHIESGDLDGVYRPYGPPKLATWMDAPTAVVPLTGYGTDGSPHTSDPRHALAAVVDRFEKRRLSPVMAFELEFHLFQPETIPPEPALGLPLPPGVSAQSMYDAHALDGHRALFDSIRRAAEAFELPLDTIVSEAGPGQFEANLRHGPAMAAADNAVALRHIVTACASAHGLRASFMAKPMLDEAGNGCHIHCSLVTAEGGNAFGSDPDALVHATGGLIDHMPASTLALIGSWNGFRRMAKGSYAPTRAIWGENNRSVAVRIPASDERARRFEQRVASADACPYTVAALVLQAAYEGIAGKIVPPDPATGNAYEETGAELPSTPRAALAAHRGSPFVVRALGEELSANLAHMLEAEFEAFERAIPDYEHAAFL